MSIRNVTNFFQYLPKHEDPRTEKWFLMSSVTPTIGLTLLYIFGVTYVGPRLMQNRKPFNLKNIVIGYNLFQLLLSLWMCYEFAVSGWLTGKYNFRCQPVDYSTNPETMRMVNVVWWYFFAKFTEFTETVFFVMRKKFKQVSGLHVYHHSIMPISTYFAVKYYPTGHGTFSGLLNSFVHIIMYCYYLLSACGPRVQKFLWWKKYITTLQLIQFVVILSHDVQLMFSDCNFPRVFLLYRILLGVSFYFLFRDFYIKAYERKQKR